MTCSQKEETLQTQEEWTINTVTDITEVKGLLVFRLNVNGSALTGDVTELPVDNDGNVIGEPRLLSNAVRGSDEEIRGTADHSFMTLIFPWGNTEVMLAGIRFRSDSPDTFRGRFRAFGSVQLANAAAVTGSSGSTVVPQAPGDGDTGTGTGTQT